MTFDPICFDFDRYNLKPTAIASLDQLGDWMSKNPAARISIEGHCDERGTNEYNLALGDRRASRRLSEDPFYCHFECNEKS